MKAPLKVNVHLWGTNIGQLAWDEYGRVATFQFSGAYYTMPYNLIPTKPVKTLAPLDGHIGDKYHGLPPFIADSLPDNWGSVVFDEWARENNLDPRACNPLMQISYIGRRGIGALEFTPEIEDDGMDVRSLATLESLAGKIYKDRSKATLSQEEKEDFKAFAKLGTPPGGAHPKTLIAISDTNDTIISGQTDTVEGYTQYILKFKEDYDVPSSELEYIYYLMSLKAGIKMMPSRLYWIRGNVHFLTQRYDRVGKQKIHSQTLAALAPGAMDYENLFFLCRILHLTEEERVELFRRMCFNIIAGNTDDHNKNFSFLMYPDGHWELAPAYDVTLTANIWEDTEADTHSLGVSGRRCYFTVDYLLKFAEDFEIENPEKILQEVCTAVSEFPSIAADNGLPETWIEKISKALDEVFPDRKTIIDR